MLGQPCKCRFVAVSFEVLTVEDDQNRHPLDPMYLHKSMPGGLLIYEVGVSQPFIYTKMHAVEFTRFSLKRNQFYPQHTALVSGRFGRGIVFPHPGHPAHPKFPTLCVTKEVKKGKFSDFRRRDSSTSVTNCAVSCTFTPSHSTTTSAPPTASWPSGLSIYAGTSTSPPSSPTSSSTTAKRPTLPATSCRSARSK